MAELFTVENLIALLTLTGLEIVLGIDNIVFIAILAGRVDPALRAKARHTGLALAMFLRVGLLLALGWIMRLTAPLFSVLGHGISGRDLILIGGGLFLLAKATYEIHHKLEDPEIHAGQAPAHATFRSVILQILALDLVFSLDSVITAVGMARHMAIMIAAVIIAVGVMLIFSGAVVGFIERHPTMKMLALSFLLLIGVVLVADGLGTHIGKGYIYFAMAFSLFVELLNLRIRARRTVAEAITLH